MAVGWESFFDAIYLHLWAGMQDQGRAEHEAAGLCSLLEPHEANRVLDPPCGYGRFCGPRAARCDDARR